MPEMRLAHDASWDIDGREDHGKAEEHEPGHSAHACYAAGPGEVKRQGYSKADRSTQGGHGSLAQAPSQPSCRARSRARASNAASHARDCPVAAGSGIIASATTIAHARWLFTRTS